MVAIVMALTVNSKVCLLHELINVK